MVRGFLASTFMGAAVAVAAAAPGSATTIDDAFITTINSYPVPYSTAADAITLARSVCGDLAAGQTVDAVVIEVSGPANWTVPQGQFFVDAAVRHYCPGQPGTNTAAGPPVALAPVVQAPAPSYPQAVIPPTSYFANCSAARGAGAAPLYAGQPGYRGALDRDGDGVACE